MTAMRAVVEPNKGRRQGTAARGPFDAIMSRVIAPAGVTFTPDTVGDVSGWWCRPDSARTGRGNPSSTWRMVQLGFGSGLQKPGWTYRRWHRRGSVRAGLSAGSGTSLSFRDRGCACLLSGTHRTRFLKGSDYGRLGRGQSCPRASQFCYSTEGIGPGASGSSGCALSPVTDLALTGTSWETRAAADPYFIRSQAAELVRSYLGGHDPADPLASPMYGELAGLPPIRVHVGDDEVLLDDSLRYVERAVAAGVDARVDVWEGKACHTGSCPVLERWPRPPRHSMTSVGF